MTPLLPPPASDGCDLLIIAGEHSGDQHAARVVRELHAAQPGLRICALGGPALVAAGAEVLHDLVAHSVVGLIEVLKNLGYFRRLMRETLAWIETHRPRALCIVDYPGFNLRLVEALAKRGLTRQVGGPMAVYMYVSPQIWAWKGGRRFKMAQVLDELGVIFPFEVDCYRDTRLPVRFVGHPFVAADHHPTVTHDPTGPVLLLPGSRRQPISRILPPMLEAWTHLRGQTPHRARRAVILYPEPALRDFVAQILARHPEAAATIDLRPAHEALGASAVLTSSGTMSLACALAGIPGAIVYRAHPITYCLGRMLVKIEHLGIANLLLQPAPYPEYIQDAAQPEALARELDACLTQPARAQAAATAAARLHQLLSPPADATVARRLLHWLASSHP